jgi:hypothetical protein
MNAIRLAALARSWRQRLMARELLVALGFALFVGAASFRWPLATRGALAVLAFGSVLSLRLAKLRPWKIGAADFARHLDRNFPPLEESSALWLRVEGELSVPERWQLRRLNLALAALEKETPPIRLIPRNLMRAGWLALLAGGVALLAVAFLVRMAGPSSNSLIIQPSLTAARSASPDKIIPTAAAPRVGEVTVTLTPPAYTGRAVRRIARLDFEVEEDAQVEWTVATEGMGETLAMVWGDGTELNLRPLGAGQFAAMRVLSEPELYHFAGTRPDGTLWTSAELHAVKIIKDQAPVLTIVKPDLPRTSIEAETARSGDLRVEVKVTASDDYGLVEAHLVATVAKGTGEGVKFREQRIAFTTEEGSPLQRTWSRTLDLHELGMVAGDELYFYVVAQDNRQPQANAARSETRFIALAGSTGATVIGSNLNGVNLIPPYFRSQRQLIIDTEKLLADRPTLADEEFRRRSENLGIDQKLLRLRYGQFLGEEFEPDNTTAAESHGPVATGSVSALVEQLQHRHDTTPEAASRAPQDQPVVVAHDHEAERPSQTGVPLSAKEMLAPYTHQHDKADEATFFEGAQKNSLRDVLAAMWEAEGQLRTVQPAAALPAENRALTILKALQESARAYVQRVGFEATPIKIDERRLKGELDEVPARRANPSVVVAAAPEREAILNALEGVNWSNASGMLATSERVALAAAEPALTAAATRQPERFLAGLQSLRSVLAGSAFAETDLRRIKEALWQLAPERGSEPGRRQETEPSLSAPYFRALSGEGGR